MQCELCEKIIKGNVFCGYDRYFCTETHRNIFINSNPEFIKKYPNYLMIKTSDNCIQIHPKLNYFTKDNNNSL